MCGGLKGYGTMRIFTKKNPDRHFGAGTERRIQCAHIVASWFLLSSRGTRSLLHTKIICGLFRRVREMRRHLEAEE